MKVTVGRSFRIREYENYRVEFVDVEVDGKEPLMVADEVAEWCLAARDRYLEKEAEWDSPDFHPAADTARRQGAEHNRNEPPSHPKDGSTPTPAPAGTPADEGITEQQLKVLQDRVERDPHGRVQPYIRRYLDGLGLERPDQLTKERAMNLLRRLNDTPPGE